MRSARLRLPSNINLLVKRATFRLLYFASGTSGRRTALLRLGTICLLISKRNKLLNPLTTLMTDYEYLFILLYLIRKKSKFSTYGRCQVSWTPEKASISTIGRKPYNLFRTPTRERLSTKRWRTFDSSRPTYTPVSIE